jgi:hypothetical protein
MAKISMEWKPASIETVKQSVKEDLANCEPQQTAAFEANGVEPRLAPITRYGKLEYVFVVAQKGDQVIYWEDIEEGFGVSEVDSDGRILEHDCNQNNLGTALNAWIGRHGR